MKHGHWVTMAVIAFFAFLGVMALADQPARAAYQHQGEKDSANFVAVHPDKKGTKLDSCALCHGGGTIGKNVVGSCQWCHNKYGYDASGNILDTLNPYGKDYLSKGRSADAIRAIETLDSDGDGYTNAEEIAATRYPGDPNDDPTKVPAPYRVFTRDELEKMPQHTQFLLMNASKSDDAYVQYSGVSMEELLKPLMLDSATGIKVFSPDGFSQDHPLNASAGLYQVNGLYPQGNYYYNAQADIALHPDPKSADYGWCDYRAAIAAGLVNGAPIDNPQGLKMLLAIKRGDGAGNYEYLTPGVLNAQNRLDGEGPFRVVPPQLIPGPPDQRSSAANQGVIWPYKNEADHNAGSSSRTTTIIRVGPLPEGTTDIDTREAGWDYVDQDKIVVYGAIDPVPTILEKLDQLIATVQGSEEGSFQSPQQMEALANKLEALKKQVQSKDKGGALQRLQQDIQPKLEACAIPGTKVGGNWVVNCEVQKGLFWATNDLVSLLKIAN